MSRFEPLCTHHPTFFSFICGCASLNRSSRFLVYDFLSAFVFDPVACLTGGSRMYGGGDAHSLPASTASAQNGRLFNNTQHRQRLRRAANPRTIEDTV